MDAHGTGVSQLRDVKARRCSSARKALRKDGPGFARDSMPSMPHAEHQFASRLARGTARKSVSKPSRRRVHMANSVRSWLYTLWLAMDANFRLRSKIRGINVDPSLCPGWAYFVENAPYAECMAKAADDVDVCPTQSLERCNELMICSTDIHMCWLSSYPQHAHEEVKRPSRNWHGRG